MKKLGRRIIVTDRTLFLARNARGQHGRTHTSQTKAQKRLSMRCPRVEEAFRFNVELCGLFHVVDDRRIDIAAHPITYLLQTKVL